MIARTSSIPNVNMPSRYAVVEFTSSAACGKRTVAENLRIGDSFVSSTGCQLKTSLPGQAVTMPASVIVTSKRMLFAVFVGGMFQPISTFFTIDCDEPARMPLVCGSYGRSMSPCVAMYHCRACRMSQPPSSYRLASTGSPCRYVSPVLRLRTCSTATFVTPDADSGIVRCNCFHDFDESRLPSR